MSREVRELRERVRALERLLEWLAEEAGHLEPFKAQRRVMRGDSKKRQIEKRLGIPPRRQ